MDLPGLHIDGVVLLSLIGLGTLLVNAYIARKVVQTHDAVNGMQAAKVSEAHQAGVVEGVTSTSPATPLTP